MHCRRMTTRDLVDFLIANQRHFLLLFCVFFGVVAQESYQSLKRGRTEIKLFLPKVIVALFVCIIIAGIIEGTDYERYSAYIIMLFAFLHRSAANWIMKDLLPTALNIAMTMINNFLKKSKDD